MKMLLALLLVVSVIGITRADAADERMNVLFLVADDLNSWLLEDADRYAGKVVAPNLRKLAASVVRQADGVLLSAARARATFSRISSAFLVHTNDLGFWLW